MEITLNWLNEHSACSEAVEAYKSQRETDAVKLIQVMLRDGSREKFLWANWLITRILSHQGQVKYAVYAAKKVLHIYEAEYPTDDRPRKAIEAAEKCLKNPSENTANKAAFAAEAAKVAAFAAEAAKVAAFAAEAAKVAAFAVANTALAAAYAAEAAEAAAFATAKAAYAVTCAAYTAKATAYTAYVAEAAYTAYTADITKKIIRYGIQLIEQDAI